MTQKSKTNVEEKDELIENQVVENDDRAEKEPVEENAKTDDEAQEQETEPESFVKKEETATDGGDESAKKTGKEIIPDDDKKEKPKAKKSTEKPAKGKAAEETVKEKVAEEKAAEETVKEKVAEEKAAEETVTEKVAEEKAAEETVTEKVAEEKAAEETVTEKVAEEKAAEETVTEKVAEEKAAEETVIEKTTAKTTKKTTKKTGKKEEKTAEGFESPDANFDWDALNKSTDIYDADQRQEYEKMYGDTLSTVAENEVVEGTVIAMNKREVVINVGYKSEGVVSLNEFRYNPDLKIGEQVEVYVESQEDKKGQLLLSHKKARALKSWDRVNEALEKDEIIKGYIKCRTKGGMIVDVFGIEAFLPGSQIDVKPIRDYDVYVGKTMEFKVVKINHEFKNVVVSHKALIEAELEQQKKEIIAKLEKGQILEGTVKNITSYGVFIDLGGVDGLIHITDLSWGRVNHPEEIVQLDQKLQVVILDFDDEKKRIALGLKQLSPHPWDSLDSNLSVGNKVKGKVVVMADYGAFVEIAPGVEGLIHVSEMSWSQHLRSAQEFLRVGDEVEAVILTLDRDERKMSLGMKQLKPDPWENIEEKYAVGSKHTAKVRNFTNFGVFVEIEEGVDGLIHISDLSWTKKIKHPAEFTNIGDEIEVVVLEIDKENRRLSLGHKQLEENPWDVFETIFTVDSIHEGTIIEISDKGAVVALQYGVEGFVTPKHLVKEDGSTARIDEKLNFKVIEFSKSAKKIVLSHSRIYEEDRKAYADTGKKAGTAAARKTPKKVKSSIEKTTLGDITDLAALKDQLERNEKQANQKKKEKKEKSDDKES
jgi:small subunit ribosomal protein S1